MEIKFVKLSNDAIVPQQNTATDAWYDLFSTEDYILKVGERKLFKTNISCAVPEWFYARIAPRSGLAYKYWIDVLAWVVDSGYRWDIWVILINFGQENFEVKKWDKIAQLIIEKCAHPDYKQLLWDYLKLTKVAHTRHNLPCAFALHDTLARKGDMRLTDFAEYVK